jgi:hypothetical protein
MESSTSFVLDLVKRLQNPRALGTIPPLAIQQDTLGSELLSRRRQTNNIQYRSDEAAVVVYRIMVALHNDLSRIADIPSNIGPGFGVGVGQKSLIPAQDYLEENVELLGYFDEILARGRQQYLQCVRVILNTLQVAIRSGGVVSERDPIVVVELTPSGNVKSSVTLSLRIKPIGSLTNLLPGGSVLDAASADTIPPIKLQVISEYILNIDTGRIVRHRLLESRVNGQLTPGDVISRWIRRLVPTTKKNGSTTSGSDDPQQVQKLVIDGLSWILSITR